MVVKKYRLIIISATLVAIFFIWKKFEKNSFNISLSDKDNIESKVLPILKNTQLSSPAEFKPNEIIQNKNKNRITNDQLAIICEFKKLRTLVPQTGKVRIHATKSSPPFLGNYIWIKSPECPKDKYSIVFFSDDGHISKEINCLETNFTELMKFSGEQADVDDVKINNPKFLNLAISGGGYFILRCPDKKLLLTRAGNFTKGPDQNLFNKDNCVVLNERAEPFVASKVIGENIGCSPEGDCLGIYDPGRDSIQELKYLNSYSFTAESGIIPNQSITQIGPKELRPYFITNALERLNDPKRGATGVTWSDHAEMNLDDINCSN